MLSKNRVLLAYTQVLTDIVKLVDILFSSIKNLRS